MPLDLQEVDAILMTTVHSAAMSLKCSNLCDGRTVRQGISVSGWSQPYSAAIELPSGLLKLAACNVNSEA